MDVGWTHAGHVVLEDVGTAWNTAEKQRSNEQELPEQLGVQHSAL